jgi:preprotein translocase subunit SecE
LIRLSTQTGLAQLVEHWSPKPGVGSSSLSTRARKRDMGEIINYIKDSFDELRDHVSWTPLMELQRMTVVVFVFSVIFALIIWLADTILSEVFELYFDLL